MPGLNLTIGSLFSGIDGLGLGLEWAGLGRVIWQAEKDEYCLKVLEKHWPNVKRYTDVKEIKSENTKKPDLICGGFPCQDVSAAGKGAGLSGSRSGLWYEFLRIVDELCPEWVVVENVASGAHRWVDFVRGDLERQGYATFPIPLSAQVVGAWHLRRRIFVVAHHNSGRKLQPERVDKNQREWLSNCDRDVSNTHQARCDGGTGTRAELPGGEKSTHCDWWAFEPDVVRVVHGLSKRVDRIKALGNSVVPQCAQVVGEFIKQSIRQG